MERWNKRFFASTRGRVVELLRRGEATVSDLAETLDLTDNAIRSHLTKLERDGIVQQVGRRPGVRKPETLYALTPDAERLFPKAYRLLLNRLLDVLNERLAPTEIEAILREVGEHIASSQPPATEASGRRARAEKAVEVLNDLGGLAELKEKDRQLVIRGHSCPLAAAVREHPEVCQLAEALLTEIVGAPVQERCERNGTPRCAFRIESSV